MEQVNDPGGLTPCCDHAFPGGTDQLDSFVDSVLTDAVLSELKKQSADACLLCALDTSDGDEWG